MEVYASTKPLLDMLPGHPPHPRILHDTAGGLDYQGAPPLPAGVQSALGVQPTQGPPLDALSEALGLIHSTASRDPPPVKATH